MRRWLIIGLLLLGGGAVRAEDYFRPFVLGSFAALQQEQRGHPLAVVFWSVTCAPCIEEMALWHAVRQQRPEARIVLVNTDEPAETARARRILDQHGMGGDAWMFADVPARRLRFEVDPTWRGELPRSYFFDRAGQPLTVVTGAPDAALLAAWTDAR